VRRALRIFVLVLAAGGLTGGVTWASSSAGQRPTLVPAVSPVETGPLVVPDVRGMPFVFAKETLEDSGFAWRVSGRVHGFPANTVTSQRPAAGTRLVFDGSPKIVLSLKRTPGYPQLGAPQDVSPYWGARAVLAGHRS
jgi:hypothetical protein